MAADSIQLSFFKEAKMDYTIMTFDEKERMECESTK